MPFDESNYGFQGGYGSTSQWDSAFSTRVAPAQMQFNQGTTHQVGNVSTNFVPTRGANLTTNMREVIIDGEKHTNVTVQMPPQFMKAMNRRLINVGDQCHRCSTGTMKGRFTTCGILLAIFLGAMGIIFMFATRDKVCDKCGLAYDYQGNEMPRT